MILALNINTRVLVKNGLQRNAITLGKSRLLLLIQELDNIETRELESIGKGSSRHYSRLVELTALRVLAMSVKFTGAIQMFRLALKVDIKFNLTQFRFQLFTILNPNKTLLMKIPIYCALNNRIQQKIEDGLIK